MRKSGRTARIQPVLLILWLTGVWLMASAGGGCSSTPKLTPEDRRTDIEFLAHWARDYHPCVEVNEKYKGTPSYEALLPRYLDFAAQAQSNEEFYQVVSGYFSIIGASGHAYPKNWADSHLMIIDVRNDGGGDPAYFRDNLIAPFLDEPVTWEHTAGIKRKYLAATKPSVLRFLRKDVRAMQVHAEEVDPPQGFDGAQWVFYEIARRAEPRERYNFHGRLYVLINSGCYSATDIYADAIKRTGMGTLVGRNTGGAGGATYVTPPMVRLPASGMVFRLEADLGINPDGSFNELVGTPPDLELPLADPPASITREALLQDEWVKRVIAEP
jgi:hypothetical protein